MATIPVAAATTAEVLHTAAVIDASAYEWVGISADNLATTEEVDVYVRAGGTWKLAYDEQATPVAIVLTATRCYRELSGGKAYALHKDATAGACAMWADFGPGCSR